MYRIIKQIIKTGIKTETAPQPDEAMRVIPQRLQQQILDVFGRALTIRHVDAGSCNGCELEIHAVNNAYYNIGGLGIKFVASPQSPTAVFSARAMPPAAKSPMSFR